MQQVIYDDNSFEGYLINKGPVKFLQYYGQFPEFKGWLFSSPDGYYLLLGGKMSNKKKRRIVSLIFYSLRFGEDKRMRSEIINVIPLMKKAGVNSSIIEKGLRRNFTPEVILENINRLRFYIHIDPLKYFYAYHSNVNCTEKCFHFCSKYQASFNSFLKRYYDYIFEENYNDFKKYDPNEFVKNAISLGGKPDCILEYFRLSIPEIYTKHSFLVLFALAKHGADISTEELYDVYEKVSKSLCCSRRIKMFFYFKKHLHKSPT